LRGPENGTAKRQKQRRGITKVIEKIKQRKEKKWDSKGTEAEEREARGTWEVIKKVRENK
jgi:hypothetical protein